MTVAAHSMIDVLLLEPFHILVLNCSTNAMYLITRMSEPYATRSHTSMMTASSNSLHHFIIWNPKKPDPIAASDDHPAPCKETKIAANSEAQQAKETKRDSPQTLAVAIDYRLIVDKESQIREFTSIKCDTAKQLATDWIDDVAISSHYQAYKQTLIDVLSQFELMWDGHHGRLTISKHRMKLFQPDTVPKHPAPSRDGPKTYIFKKGEIDEMLAEYFMELVQTEWAVLIVFVPKTNGTLRFSVNFCKPSTFTKRDSYRIPCMDEYIDPLG